MSINTSIWGSPDTWEQLSDIPTEAIQISPQTVYTALNSGLLELNKPFDIMDNSIGYARFNSTESDLAYYSYIYQDATDEVQIVPTQTPDDVIVTTPCYGDMESRFLKNRRIAYGQTYSDITAALNQRPLTFFDVQKIVLNIFVSYVIEDPADGIPYRTKVYSVGLKEYEELTGEKYIIGYGYKPYYGYADVENTRMGKSVTVSFQGNWNNIPIPQTLSISETRATAVSPYACSRVNVKNDAYSYFALGGKSSYIQATSKSTAINSYVGYVHGNPEHWSFYPSSDDPTLLFAKLTVDNEVEYIKRQVARLGFWFTDNGNSALYSIIGSNCADEHMYCPAAPVDGLFTGDYYAGVENESNPVASWEGDGRDYIIIPGEDGDENDTNAYTDTVVGQLPNLTGLGSFSNVYAVTPSRLQALSDWLWFSATSDETSAVFLKKMGLIGDNPLNAIISVQAFPFDVTNYIQGLETPIQVGYNIAIDTILKTPINAIKLDSVIIPGTPDNGLTARIDFGSIYLSQHFFNFFDYEPYTAMTLYIPFVGFVDLTSSQVTGHNLRVILDFEVLTGACVGTVYIENTVLVSKNGKMSIDVPVTGVNSAEYANSVNNSALDSKQNALNMSMVGVDAVASLASGSIGGIISGIKAYEQGLITGERIQNNRDFLAPSYSSSGGYTANSSTFLPYYPYLQITRPIIQNYNTSDYRKSLGYACNNPCKISDCSGYCEFAQVNMEGIPATETELRELYSLLQNGVIL